MKNKITINYNWKCHSDIEIPEKHNDALEEDAQKRIFEMMLDGIVSGELHTSIRYGKEVVEEEDYEHGLEYSGWWSATTETL